MNNTIFALLLIALLFQSCGNSKIQLEETIEQLLQEKYGESFRVKSSEYSKGKGMYEIKAFPINNSNLIFNCNYRKKDQYLQPFYPAALWESQATRLTKKHFSKTLDKFVNRTVVAFPSSERTLKPVPGFTQLVRKEPASIELTTRLYIFQDLNAASFEELLAGLPEYMERLQGYGVRKNLFIIHFFDEQFFKDKDLSDYNFGFNVLRPDGFEAQFMGYCRGKLMVRLKPGSELPDMRALFDGVLLDCRKNRWMEGQFSTH